MIHFPEMGKFMDHNVIYDLIRCQQKAPVEVRLRLELQLPHLVFCSLTVMRL